MDKIEIRDVIEAVKKLRKVATLLNRELTNYSNYSNCSVDFGSDVDYWKPDIDHSIFQVVQSSDGCCYGDIIGYIQVDEDTLNYLIDTDAIPPKVITDFVFRFIEDRKKLEEAREKAKKSEEEKQKQLRAESEKELYLKLKAKYETS